MKGFMKQRMIVVLSVCAAMMVSSPSAVRAQVGVSASIEINSPSDFNQPLEPYGSWVNVSSYGRCWHPREVTADWSPYTVGHWEWTDAGWYWASDEPWGWACFHYGSWDNDPQYGWVWIPGTDWAPAWVTWRYSDAYIGWAPCGPGLSVLAPSFFTFCDVHRFHDHFHSRRDLIVNNTTIINRTKVIKDFHRETMDFDGKKRTVFANKGPGVDPIRRATGQKFDPRPVRDVVRESRQPANLRHDDNQRKDARPNQQRTIEQQRRDNTPPPTGRDQQRNYQQPDNRNQPRDKTPATIQTPQQQQQNRDREREQQLKRPVTPAERTLPPTGRDEVRPAQPQHREVAPIVREPKEVPQAPAPKREIPTPPTRPAIPDRPLPPTGRQEIRPATPERPAPPVQAPAVRPAPPVRQAPPVAPGADGHGRDDRDK
jgi:hypothetical protein